MTKEALMLALEALENTGNILGFRHDREQKAITAIKEALQEHALQALHDENERLGLYKGVYEEEPQHPVHIGVDVTKEGTAVTAFYRKPDSVMEMFYSQFHPLAQPEQEPVAWESLLGAVARGWCYEENANKTMDSELAVAIAKEVQALYTTPPQRTWVGLSEEEVEACFHHVDEAGIGLFDFAEAIEAKLKEKNNG